MTNLAGYPPFYSDSRGNRLESWTVTRARGESFLLLRGPAEAAQQVQAAAPGYQSRPLSPEAIAQGWTHAFFLPQPPPGQLPVSPSVQQLLALLQEIVSVPISPEVDFSLALDWYKNPIGDDPYMWPNTEVGELVASGKYRYRSQPVPQATAGIALADRLRNAIGRHPLLQGASIVLDVPGHDNRRVSFGSRLAATVAERSGVVMSKVGTRSVFRAESKNLGRAQQATLMNEFTVAEVVQGQSVLIVDDVIMSGTSMAAVGAAARASGARQVLGICATRTMKR